ncbi:MAG TPA: hypothetical protein VN789_15070 [Casimicrobiaceae bacterium]|jgi:hypothetical protein|nr:hypothetical protein [Casimicrobiaceae bacterium]
MSQTSIMTDSTPPIARSPEAAGRRMEAQTPESPVARTSVPQEPQAVADAAARSSPVSRVAPWTPSTRDRIEGIIVDAILGAVTSVVLWVAFRLSVRYFDRIVGMT